MDTEKLVNAIRNATNGSFLPPNGWVTCLGWEQIYDEEGRPLRGDPNTHKGHINIAGTNYILSTSDFHCEIREFPNGELITEVDFTPDYIKEYREKKDKEK